MPKPIKPRLQMGCGEPLCGSLRRLRDGLDLLKCGVRPAVSDILTDRAAKERRLL